MERIVVPDGEVGDGASQRASDCQSQDPFSIPSKSTNEIYTLLQQNQSQIEYIIKFLKDKVSTDEAKNKAFDMLHAELTKHQMHEMYFDKIARPLYMDLLLLGDGIDALLSWIEFEKTVTITELKRRINSLNDELQEVLYRQNVSEINEVARHDPKIHRAVKVVETDEEKDDFSINRILRRGYMIGEKVLRPVDIEVRRCVKKETEK